MQLDLRVKSNWRFCSIMNFRTWNLSSFIILFFGLKKDCYFSTFLFVCVTIFISYLYSLEPLTGSSCNCASYSILHISINCLETWNHYLFNIILGRSQSFDKSKKGMVHLDEFISLCIFVQSARYVHHGTYLTFKLSYYPTVGILLLSTKIIAIFSFIFLHQQLLFWIPLQKRVALKAYFEQALRTYSGSQEKIYNRGALQTPTWCQFYDGNVRYTPGKICNIPKSARI